MSTDMRNTTTYSNGLFYVDYGSVLAPGFNHRDVEREVDALLVANPQRSEELRQAYIKRIASLSSAPRHGKHAQKADSLELTADRCGTTEGSAS